MSFLDRLFARTPASAAAVAPVALDATAEIPRAARDGDQVAFRVDAGLATDPGLVRETNEDFVRIVRPLSSAPLSGHGLLAVVCDGMGGHEAGEIASRLATETIVRRFEEDDSTGTSGAMELLPRAVQAANKAVFEAGRTSRAMRGMGTTCTALLLRDGLAYSAHVGDSRLYLVRANELFLMTEDHSAVMDMVRRGLITRDEARRHPDKNVISRALGSHATVEVAGWPQPFAVRRGDRFLLCSDGLYDLVPDETLLATASDVHPQTACDRLVTLAREAGGHDNISVALIAIEREGDATPPRVRETRALEALQ